MSRVQIGGAGGRRNVRLSHMQQRKVLFSDVFCIAVIAQYSINSSSLMHVFMFCFVVVLPVWSVENE